MSVIEDTRKVLQDFLAPELRAITVRLDVLEKKADEVDVRAEKRHIVAIAKIDDVDRRAEKRHGEALSRIDDVDRRIEKTISRIDYSDRRAEKRHDEVLSAIGGMQDMTLVRERLARLESKDTPHH